MAVMERALVVIVVVASLLVMQDIVLLVKMDLTTGKIHTTKTIKMCKAGGNLSPVFSNGKMVLRDISMVYMVR